MQLVQLYAHGVDARVLVPVALARAEANAPVQIAHELRSGLVVVGQTRILSNARRLVPIQLLQDRDNAADNTGKHSRSTPNLWAAKNSQFTHCNDRFLYHIGADGSISGGSMADGQMHRFVRKHPVIY